MDEQRCVAVCRTKHVVFKVGPLDLSFWLFLTFLHHGIEVERHILWTECHKEIQMKSWSNVPPKLLACIRFLYKVVPSYLFVRQRGCFFAVDEEDGKPLNDRALTACHEKSTSKTVSSLAKISSEEQQRSAERRLSQRKTAHL